MDRQTKVLDRIRGGMIGGAAGDALGYTIEFCTEDEIFGKYGQLGITEYELTDGKALISDDTQMSLFTANGLLVEQTRYDMRGISAMPRVYVNMAYQNWLQTQFTDGYDNRDHEWTGETRVSWLLDVPELYAHRAPGNTCIQGLIKRSQEDYPEDYIKAPINHSKGCGGIMRVAPVAFMYGNGYENGGDKIDIEAAQIAAITHSHPLGYMPAAVLSHIIGRIIAADGAESLKDSVIKARDAVERIFAGTEHLQELTNIIDLAVTLSENADSDLDNIHKLGEGWVAEETLAIAIYCSLRYQHDFSKAIITAVNHKGDSDSTGAVTGNIVGVIAGYSGIDEKWKNNLELADVILEMAEDMGSGCQISEYSDKQDLAWESKYIYMRRAEK